MPLCHADSSAPLVEESRRCDSVLLPPFSVLLPPFSMLLPPFRVVLPPLADSLAGVSDSMLSSRVDPFRTEGESAEGPAVCCRRRSWKVTINGCRTR